MKVSLRKIKRTATPLIWILFYLLIISIQLLRTLSTRYRSLTPRSYILVPPHSSFKPFPYSTHLQL